MDLAEELIERVMENVTQYDVYERILIYVVSVVNDVLKKVLAQFNILENEGEEEQMKLVEFETLSLSE
ncbi:hypothetical protein QUF79_03145 [Fictibacillus enclensis]|uniref:hypothetical protein n=1 Tax=Fictibacillus enclensis TaxID=1017270 RepID=UPI0025A223E9|nr:hypothetical protein [Fictibacillus enclensis]MDM5197029.1 hypothetical protein [Fictibacillus enclensis]